MEARGRGFAGIDAGQNPGTGIHAPRKLRTDGNPSLPAARRRNGCHLHFQYLHVQDRACASPGEHGSRPLARPDAAATPDPAPAAPAEAAAPEVVAVEPEATAPRPEAPAEFNRWKPISIRPISCSVPSRNPTLPRSCSILRRRNERKRLFCRSRNSSPRQRSRQRPRNLSPSRRRPEHRKRRRPKSSGRTSRRPSLTIRCTRSRR